MKQGITIAIVAVLLIALGAGGAYFLLTQNQSVTQPVSSPVSTPSPTTASLPIMEPEASTVPAGWLTYTSSTYGFEISYPNTYQALDDKNNLYGWPNGIVLLYKGGQSYDLAIEHWNSVAEYEAKYKDQSNLAVKKVGNIYITLLNTNNSAEVDQIINTFIAE